MALINDVSKETVNRIGRGAYLTNIVPSLVLVLVTGALFTSRLMPWSTPVPDAGPAQVALTVQRNPWTAGAVLVLAVVVVAVLLRPFQIAMVQVLEGYWRSRRWLRAIEALAVERHIRNAGMYQTWERSGVRPPEDASFEAVARGSRRNLRRMRKVADSKEALTSYPLDARVFLPTLLGNALRRGETTAGERYGLNTVVTYPRLQPHLGPKVEASITNQLDLIDVTSMFVVLFTLQAAISAPLMWRLDGWSAVPVVFLLLAAVAYRGARGVAVRYSDTLCVAYDLYRFDMLKALHRKLPRTTLTEVTDNQELSSFLEQGMPLPGSHRVWTYEHGS